jgi:ubiquinone/menaquinone biosynthesis C-methylase UbiE
LRKLTGDIRVADAENLPYKDNYFDFIYSWGVLHHTPDTQKAIDEAFRVLKSGGEICVMLYNRKSLVSLQMYLFFGLLRFHPFAKLNDLYSKYHESPGTKVYTPDEIARMFAKFAKINIFNQVTCYDLRCGRNSFPPFILSEFVPKGIGFFNIVKGVK